jgi:predicted transcriptional regulator of viral defense system
MTPSNPSHTASTDLLALFRAHGGQLRLSEALAQGVSRYQFYKLRDQGVIERVSRGTYRLTELPRASDPDLLVVATRFPKSVLCLVSALAWHDMTTQIPRRIDLAVARNARLPKLDYPPVRGYRFSGRRFTSGVEVHPLDGATLRVFCPEKTLADCFAYRNSLGMDVFLEAIKLYPKRHRPDYPRVLEYADICRVAKGIRPYLEVASDA